MTDEVDEVDEVINEILEEMDRSEAEFTELIQPGDLVFPRSDRQFTFSEFRYCTARKGYAVIRTKKVIGPRKQSSVCCESDIVGEHLYLPTVGISRVERDGKVIWRSDSKVWFRYLKDRPEELPTDKDVYGHPIVYDKVFEGYYIAHHDVTDEFPESHAVTLVELITPFRDGQPGQLICVNQNELEFIKEPDASSSNISHQQ